MDGYWVVARPVVGVSPGFLHTDMPHVTLLKNEWLAYMSIDCSITNVIIVQKQEHVWQTGSGHWPKLKPHHIFRRPSFL